MFVRLLIEIKNKQVILFLIVVELWKNFIIKYFLEDSLDSTVIIMNLYLILETLRLEFFIDQAFFTYKNFIFI